MARPRNRTPVSLIEKVQPAVSASGSFLNGKMQSDDDAFDLPSDMMRPDGAEEAAIVDISDRKKTRDNSIKKTADGGIIVTFDGDIVGDDDESDDEVSPLQAAADAEVEKKQKSFEEENLAEELSEDILNTIAQELLEMIDADTQANAPWEKRLEAGMRIIGIAPPSANELPFKGAASLTHPLIAEAVVQFNARSYPELMPPNGPVKTKILGISNEDVEKAATRVERHMNYQITVEDECYPEEMDQLLFYLPLAGSAFKKTYFDDVLGYTTSRFVRGEDVIMPYNASSMESAQRFAIRIKEHHNELRKKQVSGFYRDIDLSDPMDDGDAMANQQTLQAAYDQADGKLNIQFHKDPRHCLYEAYIDWDIPGHEHKDKDGKPTGIALPYIITVDKESQKILAIRRNYRKNKPLKARRYVTHYKYLPGLGSKGFGLVHAIGGLAEACTGSIRALLDSASFATLQGGFKSKDARVKGGEISLTPGTWTDVDLTSEELSKAFYTPPFKEPSMAMFKLLEIMEQNGRRYLGTTEAAVGDAPANGPVGTTVALIEQSTKVMSGIHRRLHRAQSKEFRIRAEINAEYLPEGEIYFNIAGANEYISREDYLNESVSVVPVSDPNIVSSTQRIALAQSLKQLSLESPDLYDKVKVEENMLRALGFDNTDEFLITQEELPLADPITEGARLLAQKKIKAFQAQDHAAHEAVHMAQIEYYKTLGDQQIAQALIAQMMEHIAKHKAYELYNQMQAVTGTVLPEIDLYAEDAKTNAMPPDVERAVSVQAAQYMGLLIADMRAKQSPPPEDAEAQAKIQRDEMLAAKEEERKQKAFEGEEARKEAAFQAEQSRKAIIEAQKESDRMRMEQESEATQTAPVAPAINEKESRELEIREREIALKEREADFREQAEINKLEMQDPEFFERKSAANQKLQQMQAEWEDERAARQAERDAAAAEREAERIAAMSAERETAAAMTDAIAGIGKEFAAALSQIAKQNASAMAKIEVAISGIANDHKNSTGTILGGLEKISSEITAPKTIEHTYDDNGNIVSSTSKIVERRP